MINDFLEQSELRNNPAIYIEERDYSQYNITQFYNRMSLVIGSSKIGPPNLPVVVVSPENFEQIFGEQDKSLERKGSYFHRTVKNMLIEGPVICLNLQIHDENIDRYEFINLSTSSDTHNSQIRSNPTINFYNTLDGTWKRDVSALLDIAETNSLNNPINFANIKEKDVSILMFRSDMKGFDITVESYYKGKYPDYLHPKDLISDYLVETIVIQGDWSDYSVLSNSYLYSKYFSIEGIRKEYLNEFLNLPQITVLKRWNSSLIPYFKDQNGKDMWIQTLMNDDLNETGILVAVNNDAIEEDIRNGRLDTIGDNLTYNKNPEINFMSYKKYMTDFFIVQETTLDIPSNSFGNHLASNSGRNQLMSEGYVYGVKMKTNLFSTTSTIDIRPFIVDDEEAYGIINGKYIPITSDISDSIALHNILKPNTHCAYLILLTTDGIRFRFSNINSIEDNLYLPTIDYKSELVLAYYEFSLDNNTNYTTILNPVVLGSNGYINPFRTISDSVNDIKINVEKPFSNVQTIRFEKIGKHDSQNYNLQRINHLWYWLSQNLSSKSIVLDINNNKQNIKWIEQYNNGDDKIIKYAVDSNIDITITDNLLSLYMIDNEFLAKNQRFNYQKPPLSFGTNGIIGYDSFLKDSYLKGFINSGDPFFWSFSEELNIQFVYASDINQNLIVCSNDFQFSKYIQRKVVIDGSQFNDGIWNVLDTIIWDNKPCIVVQESVVYESVNKITFYDASKPYIINLYDNSGYSTAILETWNGEPEELYRRLKDKDQKSIWSKTLEIESIIESNKILVSYERYKDKLEIGYYLLSNRKSVSGESEELRKNWTRIVDLQRTNEGLIVTTDAQILWKRLDTDNLQTSIMIPIYKWVDHLDFKVLKGHKYRNEMYPDNSDTRLKEILSLLHPNTKLHKTLLSDKYEWRYLVDSYGGGLYESSKSELAKLCENKKFALGFINVPSLKEFKQDGDKFSTKNRFDTKKLLMGGDRKNNFGQSYSIPNSTHAVYLAPYVILNEASRFIKVPPSAYIARMFMSKHNDRNMNVWDVLAGVNFQIPEIVGLEELLDNDSLVDLNVFGITVLTSFENYIYYIFNEKTAVSENSVLQYTHNRELLIEFEMSMYKALAQYQWNFILPALKETIETTANEVCKYYKSKDGISLYRNEFILTSELIDNQMGILNTYIELGGTMQSILYRVSINKTNTIQR